MCAPPIPANTAAQVRQQPDQPRTAPTGRFRGNRLRGRGRDVIIHRVSVTSCVRRIIEPQYGHGVFGKPGPDNVT